MAAPFLRFGRLSEQRLRMESSFGVLGGTASVVNFSTKAGNPKKPIRYTSIKKAKPKTVIDIGKLLLQRASEAKVNKQSVIAEAALKAATQAAKPTALKPSAALSESVAAVASAQKAPTDSSEDGSLTLVAADLEDATPKVSDVRKPSVTSTSSEKGSDEATKPNNIGQEHAAAIELPPDAPGSLELPPPLGTSVEATTGQLAESPQQPVHKTESDEIASTAAPEAVSDAVPIDVTYSEEVVPISDFTDVEIASTEPSVGVLSGTVTGSGSVSAVDVPEVFIPGISPAEHTSTKVSPPAEGVEIRHASEKATSTPAPLSEDVRVDVCRTQTRDVRPEAPTNVAYVASSSKIITVEETIAGEISPEMEVSPHAVPPHVVPYEHTAIASREVVASSDVDSEKAVSSATFSRVLPVGLADEQTTAEDDVAMSEKVLDLTPESISEASAARSPDPAKGEVPGEAEGEEAIMKPSEAQLDPIQRLFLDKIREYTTKSKAHNGLFDASPEYEKAFSEELTKLQRLYGNGDLTAFPEFKFPEPVLDDISSK